LAGQRTVVDLRVPEKSNGPKVMPTPEPKPEEPRTDKPKSRTFLFTYRATVTDLPDGKMARIWLPLAISSDDQVVKVADDKDLPAGFKITKEKKFGNSFI